MSLSTPRRTFLRQSLTAVAGGVLAPRWLAAAEIVAHPLGVFPRDRLPQPILPAEPGLIALYWQAWQLAWNHVVASPGAPQSPYLDEAASPNRIWIWDTCFMALFCRYAPTVFPGIESLQNFYAPLHDGTASPLTIRHWDNPPLFAWIELEHFRHTGDVARVRWLLEEKGYLQKHFAFFDHAADRVPAGTDAVARREDLGYRWSGNPSGMDNTPRGKGDYDAIYWVDALGQQALSARCIRDLAQAIDRPDIAAEYDQRCRELAELLNRHYWDAADGFYYDIARAAPHGFCRVRTPASYWPLLAGVCDERQAAALHAHAMDPAWFGGAFPWPTVTPDSPYFSPTGHYWRGGVWLPTAYMGIKGLERAGYAESARILATRLLRQMERTARDVSPSTIWECYSPTANEPSTKKDNVHRVRPDFCGWSALGPISLFIENVLGIHTIDARRREVHWHVTRTDRHGIRRLRIGEIVADLEIEGDHLTASTSAPLTLFLNGQRLEIVSGIYLLNLKQAHPGADAPDRERPGAGTA